MTATMIGLAFIIGCWILGTSIVEAASDIATAIKGEDE